jgi:hypothetical protein
VFPPEAQSVQGPRCWIDYFISNEVHEGFAGQENVVEREYGAETSASRTWKIAVVSRLLTSAGLRPHQMQVHLDLEYHELDTGLGSCSWPSRNEEVRYKRCTN